MAEALRPWSGLQPGVATLLRPALPAAIDGSIAAIDRELPAFRAGLDGDLGRTVRRGVEIALNRLLDLMGTDRPALDARARHVYESLGEGEGAQGRSLDTLLAAYRIGARVTWADLAAAAVRGGVGTDQLVLLAEAIFVYIDELSAASASGFARRQAADAGYRDVLRSRLAEALIDGDAASALPRVRRLAEDAAWPIPERLTVALVNLPGGGDVPPGGGQGRPRGAHPAEGRRPAGAHRRARAAGARRLAGRAVRGDGGLPRHHPGARAGAAVAGPRPRRAPARPAGRPCRRRPGGGRGPPGRHSSCTPMRPCSTTWPVRCWPRWNRCRPRAGPCWRRPSRRGWPTTANAPRWPRRSPSTRRP